jgi:hypothetical protein
MKFSTGNISWEALRVILALKFGVLPRDLDSLSFPEVSEILSVLDGQGKAEKDTGR